MNGAGSPETEVVRGFVDVGDVSGEDKTVPPSCDSEFSGSGGNVAAAGAAERGSNAERMTNVNNGLSSRASSVCVETSVSLAVEITCVPCRYNQGISCVRT